MVPEPPNQPLDIAKGIRLPYYHRVAHMGMMLEKMNRQNKMAERIQQFAATGDATVLTPTPAEEQEMGVSIGNEIHYHITNGTNGDTPPPATPPIPAPAPDPVVEPEPEPTPTPEPIRIIEKAKLGWPGKALLAAGALGTGMGIAAVANEYWYQQDPPPIVVDTDSDTITEVDFPD